MYGYIYETTNNITGDVYIGQKKSNIFIHNYYGSGNNIKEQIKKYGKENFSTSLLKEADSKEVLDQLEREIIEGYKDGYGDKCINQATGGSEGVNAFEYASKEEKQKFSEKMSIINKARCNSDEFKQNTSIRMTKLYSDDNERKKQSDRIKKAWENDELRKNQSDKVKEAWKRGDKNNDNLKRRCSLELNEEYIEFDSVAELKEYMSENLKFSPTNPSIHKMLESDEPYKPYHKNKFGHLEGLNIKFI